MDTKTAEKKHGSLWLCRIKRVMYREKSVVGDTLRPYFPYTRFAALHASVKKSLISHAHGKRVLSPALSTSPVLFCVYQLQNAPRQHMKSKYQLVFCCCFFSSYISVFLQLDGSLYMSAKSRRKPQELRLGRWECDDNGALGWQFCKRRPFNITQNLVRSASGDLVAFSSANKKREFLLEQETHCDRSHAVSPHFLPNA